MASCLRVLVFFMMVLKTGMVAAGAGEKPTDPDGGRRRSLAPMWRQSSCLFHEIGRDVMLMIFVSKKEEASAEAGEGSADAEVAVALPDFVDFVNAQLKTMSLPSNDFVSDQLHDDKVIRTSNLSHSSKVVPEDLRDNGLDAIQRSPDKFNGFSSKDTSATPRYELLGKSICGKKAIDDHSRRESRRKYEKMTGLTGIYTSDKVDGCLIEHDVYVVASLIHLYSWFGVLAVAQKVFDDMHVRDVSFFRMGKQSGCGYKVFVDMPTCVMSLNK
ncbi:hypothetical protein V8G54_013765 [Vigna mungo]|uniref:Uncharacterized protein n=1 Tax=Vigna mungo TaxID=3915 RepID=A0AAQ3NHU6_VIGMU